MAELQITIKRFCPKTLADFTATEDFGDFRSLGCYRCNYKDNNVQNFAAFWSQVFWWFSQPWLLSIPFRVIHTRCGQSLSTQKQIPRKVVNLSGKILFLGFGGPMQCLEGSANTHDCSWFILFSAISICAPCVLVIHCPDVGKTYLRSPHQICCCSLGMIQFLVLFFLYLLFQSNS